MTHLLVEHTVCAERPVPACIANPEGVGLLPYELEKLGKRLGHRQPDGPCEPS